MAFSLTRFSYWTSLSLPGQDLRGFRAWNGAISGSDFQNADLSESIFKNVIITRTSFEGADFTAATLENVSLFEVTCVDGSIHTGESDGCL